jgi:hypothetical protein
MNLLLYHSNPQGYLENLSWGFSRRVLELSLERKAKIYVDNLEAID